MSTCDRNAGSLPVGVGVFLRRENPEFAILTTILENTRRGGAGRAIVDKEATRGEGGGRCEKNERLLDNYPPMSLNPLTMTLTVTCHALAMDQSKSSKGPIVFKLSSASTKTNPRGLKLSNSRGTFLSWRMELRETPKKSANASRENPKEQCRFCKTKLVIRYGRVAYISTENIFTISKRKEYSDKPEFRGLENKTSSQLCAELGFNVAKSDKLSDRICKPCGRNLRNTYCFYKRLKSVEENDRANAEASDKKTAETERGE